MRAGPFRAVGAERIILIVGAIFLVVTVLGICFRPPAPPKDPLERETRDRLDSLIRARPEYERQADSALNATVIALQEARIERKRAQEALSAANRARRQSDDLVASLRLSGSSTDSIETLRGAFVSERRRGDSLEVTVSSLERALVVQDTALARTMAILQGERERRLSSEGLNEAIRRDLARGRDCKILGLVRCPSRGQALVGGIVIGAAAAAFAR